MIRKHRIAVLAGDGIGPEIVGATLRVLEQTAVYHDLDLEFHEALIGGEAYDRTGHPLPPETLAVVKSSDAALLGAVGGPKWDTVQPASLRPEVGALLPLRKEMGLFANLRPVTLFPSLAEASSLRHDLVADGLDILVVRELTGGIYFGQPKGRDADGQRAVDTCEYTRPEIERIARVGFEAAERRSGRLVSVDKANVLETSRLWREVVTEIGREYPDVLLSHLLVDNCAMQLVRDPRQFDVILTENMFGDIFERRSGNADGQSGNASLGKSGQCVGGARHVRIIRTGARLRTRHRRQGRGKPAGNVPFRRFAAALFASGGTGRTAYRNGGLESAGKRDANGRHRPPRRLRYRHTRHDRCGACRTGNRRGVNLIPDRLL